MNYTSVKLVKNKNEMKESTETWIQALGGESNVDLSTGYFEQNLQYNTILIFPALANKETEVCKNISVINSFPRWW